MTPKFRIYDKEEEKYCEEDAPLMLCMDGCVFDRANEDWFEVGERYIVEFQTGNSDGNSVPISSGDVLEVILNDDEETKFTCPVIYGNNGKIVNKKYLTQYPCSFTIFNDEFYKQESLLGYSNHEYKIIGTIHDEKYKGL